MLHLREARRWGFTPGYLGKATKRLKQEIFTPDKLNQYHRLLIKRKKGTPVFFFVLAPVSKVES
jgi:hypothetical protein